MLSEKGRKQARWATAILAMLALSSLGVHYYDMAGASPSAGGTAYGGALQGAMPCTNLIINDTTNGVYETIDCGTHQLTYGGTGNAGSATGTSFQSVLQTTANNMCSGGLLSLGAGIFDLTSTYAVPSCNTGDLVIKGTGYATTKIEYSGTGTTCGTKNCAIKDTGGINEFRDFELDGPNSGTTTGINFTATAQNRIDDLKFTKFTIDFWDGGSPSGDAERDTISNSNFGDKVTLDTTKTSPCGALANLETFIADTFDGVFTNGDATCNGGTANTVIGSNFAPSGAGTTAILTYGNNFVLVNPSDEANNIILDNEGNGRAIIEGGDLQPPTPGQMGGLGIKNGASGQNGQIVVIDVRGESFISAPGTNWSGSYFSSNALVAGTAYQPIVVAAYAKSGLAALVANAISYTPPASGAACFVLTVMVDVDTAVASNTAVTLTYHDAAGDAKSYAVQLQEQGTTTLVNNINNVAGAYSATVPFCIDASGTAITVSTTGTTQTLYDLSATLTQVQ